MLEPLFLPSGALLRLGAAEISPERVTVDVHTTTSCAVCPGCQCEATRVHSHYQPTLADLPLAHIPVQLHLHVRRFFCDNANCRRTTLSEAVPGLMLPYARRTTRLLDEQRHLGLEIGGEPGSRLARRQGMVVSADTLLRLARREPPAPPPTPRYLGIDDVALRKGQRYGTIFVDLATHRPVDRTPERSAQVVEEWLKEHPGVELMTRDRAHEFAEGASRGAPDAVQVADRFHLLQHVREMLQRVLERHQAALQAATKEPSPTSPPSPAGEAASSSRTAAAREEAPALPAAAPEPPSSLTTNKASSQERRNRRQEQYQEVQDLRTPGLSYRAIAARLHLSRQTVRRYSGADQFPERATRRPVPSKRNPFVPVLEQRLAAGEDHARQLWPELRDQHGFTGSRALVSRWVAQHRHLIPAQEHTQPAKRRRGRPAQPAKAAPPAPQRWLSARKAAWLLVCRPDAVGADDQPLIERLCAHAPAVAAAHQLAQAFIEMVRERQAPALEDWLARATASGIPELQTFATGIERDKPAVEAALSLSFSNGQVEGQVNRVKLIKRMAYGRANFDLLRQRVLAPTGSSSVHGKCGRATIRLTNTRADRTPMTAIPDEPRRVVRR
jgi:transposase